MSGFAGARQPAPAASGRAKRRSEHPTPKPGDDFDRPRCLSVPLPRGRVRFCTGLSAPWVAVAPPRPPPGEAGDLRVRRDRGRVGLLAVRLAFLRRGPGVPDLRGRGGVLLPLGRGVRQGHATPRSAAGEGRLRRAGGADGRNGRQLTAEAETRLSQLGIEVPGGRRQVRRSSRTPPANWPVWRWPTWPSSSASCWSVLPTCGSAAT